MGIATRAPSCLFECYNGTTSSMDPYKYYQYRRSQRNGVRSLDILKMVAMCATIAKDESKEQARLHCSDKRKRGSRSSGEERLMRDADGQIRPFNAYDTDWYYRYVSNPDPEDNKFQRKFRRRFRCSYETFTKHLDEVKSSPLFKQWEDGRTDFWGVLLLQLSYYCWESYAILAVDGALTTCQNRRASVKRLIACFSTCTFCLDRRLCLKNMCRSLQMVPKLNGGQLNMS